MAKADCSTCIHYDVILGFKAVCKLWMIGLDMRGYKPCEEYKEVTNDKCAKNGEQHE